MLSAPPQSTVAPGAPRQRWGVLALGALIWLLDLAGIAHLPLMLGVVLLVVGGPIAMMLRFAQVVMGIISLARP